MKYFLSIFLGVLASLSLPATVLALDTHNYICTDWTLSAGASCSANTLSINTGYDAYDATHILLNNSTYYITFTTDTTVRLDCTGAGSCGSNAAGTNYSAGTYEDIELTITGGNMGIYWTTNGTTATGIYDICTTGTIGGCASVPAGNPTYSGDWFLDTETTKGVTILSWFWLEVGTVMFYMLILGLIIYKITDWGVSMIKRTIK